MRRLALLAALVLAACSNSDPIKEPSSPPSVSTTTIHFSTYLGDDRSDIARDLLLDGAGNVLVVGGARSADLLPGTPTRAFGGEEDAFVAKLDPNGQVLWWTFLGGPGPDRGYAIELDPNGDVVIGGSAANGFPVTAGAALTQFQGGAGLADTANPALDGFVAKLAGADGALLWATYFGSGTFEVDADPDPGPTEVDFNDDNDPRTSVVRDVAVGPADGAIYLTFSVVSSSTRQDLDDNTATLEPFNRNLPSVILDALANGNADRPTAPGLDAVSSGVDGMLAKLSNDGATLLWATFVGGAGNESDDVFVRLDAQGNPVVLLSTEGADRVKTQNPTTFVVVEREPIAVNGPDVTANGGLDFYLVQYSLDGSMLWSTFVGGRGDEKLESGSLAVGPNAIVIAAQTSSPNFTEIGADAFDPTYNGAVGGGSFFDGDCAIATVSPDGDAVLAKTFFGGAGGEGCTGVAIDSVDRIYVAGGTTSTDLPIKAGPYQAERPGSRSTFLAAFSADLTTLHHSGYFGATGLSSAFALVMRPPDSTATARVVFAGEAGAGYPLTRAPGTPARGTVTAPPEHGALSDLSIELQ